MKTLTKRKKHAFTMMELVIVIAIIALLAAIGTPAFMNFLDQAKKTAAEAQIKAFGQAANMYKIQKKKYPSSLEDLCAVQPDGTYFMEQASSEDPWGNPYQVSTNGGQFIITSYGADGVAGGEGINEDITNGRKK